MAGKRREGSNPSFSAKRGTEVKTVVEVDEAGEVLSSTEVLEDEEVSIKRKKSAWEEVVKVYGWNNPTILRTEELYKVVREKEVKGFAQAKRQCEKWAVELYNEGLVIY